MILFKNTLEEANCDFCYANPVVRHGDMRYCTERWKPRPHGTTLDYCRGFKPKKKTKIHYVII